VTQPVARDYHVPPLKRLHRSAIAAVLVGATLVLTTVLPAEYGVDPSRVGRLLGLTEMGEMKREQAAPPRQGWRFSLIGAAHAQAPAPRNDEIQVTLKPGETAEVKAFMKVGDEMTWKWSTVGGKLNFDFHGEPPNAPADKFTSYAKGAADKAEGAFKPKFAGTHGWFWRNRTSQTITVTVSTSGRYEKLERVK
jgi:hypothetical protein